MSSRKIDALRRLAERPGTEHEGIVARAMLAKLQAKQAAAGGFRDYEAEYRAAYAAFAERRISLDEFIAATRKHTQWVNDNLPTEWTCDCGTVLPVGQKCREAWWHLDIQTQIRAKFKIGDRVYYNRWAYAKNSPGRVSAYLKTHKMEDQWGWISVKFDHLKSSRQVPIFSAKGWHLSHEPITDATQQDRLSH